MPIIFCPECEAQLRLSKPVPPGKWLRCPKCEHTFSPTGEEDVEEVEEDTPRRAKRRERDEDLDDEEDRPRKPRKKSKKGSGNLTVILLAAGGGVILLGAIVTLVIVFWPFGGPYAKYESVVKDLLKLGDELATILESVQDPASAKQAAEKINGLKDRFEKLSKRTEELPELPKEDHEKLRKKYEGDVKKMEERLQKAGFQAMMKAGRDPTLLTALMELAKYEPKARGKKLDDLFR